MEKNEITENLNREQREAVMHTEGPLLILAGAGSGKTRVIVHRIAYLIGVQGVAPGNILAITFTNKAADEMRSRVDRIVGFGSREIWVSTFHSFCVRILRRYAEKLGFTRYFSIYDTDDQLTVMKNLFKERNINTKSFRERGVLSMISSAKDELIDPKQYRAINSDFYGKQIADFYDAYQRRLKESNAMDFDDLICQAVRLFRENPDILDACQERFRYLMIDEYQDTNTAQFQLVALLAGKYGNLCVVGDDDQSIYRFRGANIRNILNFEKYFPGAKVVRLEQNYRSTQNILDAANAVISHNHGRKEKKLWTEAPAGEKIRLRRFETASEEADFIINDIRRKVKSGRHTYRDCAVLYRTNAQSRILEEKALMFNVPYRIVGGVNFYSRREIKDILAYLKTVDNAVDEVAVRRIINVPKRGIGATTLAKIAAYAESGGISFFDAARRAGSIPGLSKAAAKKVFSFTDSIMILRANAEEMKIPDLIKSVLEETEYRTYLEAEGTDEARERLDNIDELVSKAVQYEEGTEEPSLSGFLEEVALVADIDTVDENESRVLFMTLHAAKGLEFPAVYMAGMEDGVFPGYRAINSDNPGEDLEEERRLAYVGITRAKEELTLTAAERRMINGQTDTHPLSRFVREIPRELIDSGTKNAFSGGRMQKGGNELSFGRVSSSDADDETFPGSGTGTPAHVFSGVEGAGKMRPRRQPAAYANPYISSPSSSASRGKAEPDYAPGDTVQHVKFGTGKVLSIADGGRDYLVTVDFPGWGVKKMYAAFAKLKKV